ncbi:MAG: sensor histidine kinase [Gaiellaceae bacterium]
MTPNPATREAAIRRELTGLAAGALAVAVVTVVIWGLKPYVPVLSLGALYVLGVLPIAVFWGLPYAVAVSVASMLAFNWFFLPPVHTFTLADSRNWFALGVFVATGVVVSELAARMRRQARESSLLAEIATSLLEHGDVSGELDRIAAETARALEVERATITLGPEADADGDAEAHALSAGGRRLGTIYLAGRRRGSAGARRRLLPALASLLGVAIDRERLAGEAFDAEALRRSDALKTALLRAVTHDLRTPLMGILTSASALAQGELVLDEADRADLLATVLDEAHRLDRLVANLLDLSRLQAGAARPEPELAAVDDLVVEALDELGADGARVEVTLADEPAAVQVDSHQIQRALLNLIENALKYSPPETPVHVRVAVTSSEVSVRVIDQGPGVAAGELGRIFEPFQRGSGSAAVRGAGLGLAIAQGFAEANGGRVSVESRSGQGATFVLTLPVANVAVEAL